MYQKCAVTLRDFPDLSAGYRLIRGCNDFSHAERDKPRSHPTLSPNYPNTNLRHLNSSLLIWTRAGKHASFFWSFLCCVFLSFFLSSSPTGQHCRLRGQPVGDLLPGERGDDPGPECSLPGAAQRVGEARLPEQKAGQKPSLHNMEYLEIHECFFSTSSCWIIEKSLNKCF